MTSELKIKPTPIWPIWVFYGIFVVFAAIGRTNPDLAAKMLLVPIIVSIMVYSQNKNNFGKNYNTDPKPTEKIIEKSKNISFVFNKKHEKIVYIVIFLSFALGLFLGGIFPAVLFWFGSYLITSSIIRLVNKKGNKKDVLFLIIGVVLIILGVWLSYLILTSTVQNLVKDDTSKCYGYCQKYEDDNAIGISNYYIEFNQSSKTFFCHCVNDNNETLVQTNLNY